METGVVTIQEPVSTKTNVGGAPAGVIPDNSSMEVHKVSVQKPVIEENHTEAKHSPEQEEEIGHISKAHEEIPIKTDEVKEEKDSRTVETSVNETEAEHNTMVSVEEISRNGDNIVNETVPEDQTATNGESLQHDIETTKRVLLEVKKEEEEAESLYKTDANIVDNEETTAHESKSLSGDNHQEERAEPVEAIRNSDDAEQISREVTVDKENEEEITQNTEEIQESHGVIETSKIQGEDIESKASLEPKDDVDHSSKDIEEHEHVLERDVPQCKTLEAEAVETKEETKPSLDLKEDKEKEETETVKTVISADEVRSSAVQEEEFGEHTKTCSSEIKDESHGREESVEVKPQETVQEESTEEKHEDLLDVPSTESEKYQENEPQTALVSNTERHEKFEEIPSDLALNVDKADLNDEKINVDQVDGTQIMEEKRGLDSNGVEAEQIDRNRTDETEESPIAKQVSLPDVEPVEQMQKPSLDSPSQVSEETSKTVDEKIKEKPEEEKVTLHQEDQEEGSYGLETKEETVSVPECIELGEEPQEERSVIDLTPLQGESSQPNEQKEETKLEKHEPRNEEAKSDEVIEVSSASPSKELEGETIVEAEKTENKKENEDEQAADKIQKSLETVEKVESHSSLPSSSEEQERGTVFEKIEAKKGKEEEPMVQIKSEDDATKSHERQEEFSKDVEMKETTVVQAEQTRDIQLSLTEICSLDQSQPEEQVKETCSRDEQKKEISNETNAVNSTEAAVEETATNGESLHDVETTKSVLLEMEKEEEETEIKTDAEPRLDGIEKEEKEIVKTVEEDAMIVNNEETTAHESKSFEGDNHQEKNAKPGEAAKNLDDAEKISREVLVDRETEEDTTQKTEEVQESSRVIETPTIQGASKASLELKEEVDQSSKDTVEHEHVLGRDIPQCETLEAEVVEAKEETKPSLDLKEDKEKEAKPSDQVGVPAEEFGEHTEPCSLEIKDASQGSEESFEVKSKETVQDESTEMKHEDLLDAPSGESEKFQENIPQKTLVLKIESQAKSEEIPLDLALKVDKEELKDKTNVDKVDGTQTIEEQRGLNLDDPEAEQIDRNITEESPVEHPVSVPVQKPSLESSLELTEETSKTINEKLEDKPKEEGQEEGSYGLEIKEETIHNQTLLDVESVIFGSELSEETSETVDEKIEDKPKEEVTLHQEGQDEGSNELEKKEETVSVPESRELGEQAHEEESRLQNEQENEKNLQKEYEPTKEEVSNDQQSPVGETFDEVIQISSVSPSEGPENETVVEAEKIGEEQVADKIQKISETVEIVEPHSSLPSSSKEQDHGIVSEKTDDEKVKDAEPTGDMSEKGLEISETTPLSLPSVDQKEDVKAFDEEIQIPSVALSLDEQKKVTSTEKGKTKAKETEDDKQDEHVDSSTLTAATEKGDEEITVGTSKLSENVCMQQEEFGTLEVTKLEELKEDNSQEIAETTEAIEATSDQTLPIETSQTDNTHSSKLVSEQDDDQTPKQVEEIYEEEHKVEATGDQNLPVETSQAYQSPSSDLVSTLNDQTPKQVEETHEEETKEEHKLQAEEILPTEIIPRESSDGALVSMLASKEDGQVTLQEDNCADDVRETKDTQEERPVSVEIEESVGETKPKEPEDEMRDEHVETPTSSIILEKNDNETLIAEAKKGDDDINETERTVALGSSGTSATSENVCIKQEEFVNHEAPKLEESKEETSQEIPETTKAIETMSDQTLPIETSQVDQTLSSKLVPGLDDQTPRQFEEIHEEEEAKEEQKLKVAVDQILLVETSQADQTPSLVSEQDDQIPKRVEEIHEEETKETQKVQAEEILFTETVPRESFSEAPVSMLAPGEDEQVSPQEGNCAGDTQEERHVSVETEEKVGETNPKESEAEEREKSNDQVETSRELTEVEDESTKKTDVEVAELTNDYPRDEAEHGDENYSTLPVVGILTELQTTLETGRTINNSASSGENMIKEPADQEQKTGDAEVESNEKDSATRIIEANRLQQDESGETEKFQEENGLAGKTLPVEEISLQEEHKEKVKVQDGISREFEFNVEEKLHEETREIAECKEEISADPSLTEVLPGEKILIPSSALPSEELEHLNSDEKQEDREPQQDFNGSTSEKISLQEEHLRDFDTSKKEKKEETHETVKEEDQIVDIKDEKNDDEEQEIVSSEVKKDKEDASELGVGNDFVSRDVEKEEAPHSVFEYEEEINKVVTSEEQTTDPVGVITKASEAEHESNEEHVKSQVISDDSKSSNDRDFSTEQAPKDQREEVTADNSLTKEALAEQIQVPSSTVLDDFQENSNLEADRDLSVQKPSELIQSHQYPNQVEETSFEVRKAQEDKKEETVDALITNVQVQDQPKDFEAPAIQKEISEQEQKSNDTTEVQEDIGTNIKPEVRDDEIRGDGHDSVVALKEGTGLIEEKRDVEHVKTELEDAIKHGVSIEEKNNMSEKIDREATKEINQEESKQTYTVKEEIREEEKETNQECFSNVQKTDDAINKTTPAIGEIGSLSSVSKTQDKAEQKDEVPNQQNREIADEVPKIAEEVQQKDGESENTKGLFSEVKECEPTSNEPARKSLSDLIQKVKGIDKIEDATTEPHMKEELKTEEEKDDGDHEHKDDKTSPDSIVMVEAKDTVSIIKTHKKSQGILSGVGSKVKHSIFKVKKVLTGKSSHTTKPSSPK